MKKLILPLLVLGFVFTSCQKEDLSSQIEMDAIAAKAKISQEKAEEESCSDDGNCETAFGRKCLCPIENECFLNLGFNRWGWSVELNRPDTYQFNFYAGAGQCDYDGKGTPVGSADVIFEDGVVSVENLTINAGFELKEFHFYAGDTEIPVGKNGKSTVAPGQYYNEGDKNIDGTVYVILHSVICGDFED